MQFIVHIFLFSHDMKVCHRPVLDSGRQQIERYECTVLEYLPCHCAWTSAKKTTLAVAVIGCNAADSGKINDRHFCSHVWAHCCLVGKKKKRLTKRKRSLQKRRVCSQPYYSTAHTWRSIC